MPRNREERRFANVRCPAVSGKFRQLCSRSSCGPFSPSLRRYGPSPYVRLSSLPLRPAVPTRRAVHAPAGRAERSGTIVSGRPGPDKRPARDEGACMQAPHATGHVRYGSARSRGGYGRRDRVGPRDRSEDGSDPVRCGAPGSSCFIRSGGASGQPACPPAKEGGDARGRTIIDTSRFRGRPVLGAIFCVLEHC